MDISELTSIAQKEVRYIRDTIASAGNTDMNVLLMHINTLESVVKQMQKYSEYPKTVLYLIVPITASAGL